MALTQQQIDATKRYRAGEITSDQYKQLYVTNYNPAKDPTAGKNMAYSGTSSPEAIKILQNSQDLINAMQQQIQPQAPVQQIQPPVQKLQQPIPQPMQQPAQINNAAQNTQINEQYKSQTDAMVAELKNRIAQSVQKQQGLISKAPQTYDPMRSQSELAKGQELRSVLERNSLMGDRGGVGRQSALQTQTEGENRLNSINLQQQNFIDTANQEIASLETQGLFEEASIVASQRSKELQALLEQQRYDQQRSDNQQRLLLEQSRYDQERATEQSRFDYGVSQDLAQTQASTQDQVVQDFISTIGRFARDYSSEVNRNKNDGDTSNDWQIPFLEQAKQEKIQSQGLDPNTGRPLPVDNTPQLTSSSAAIDLWKQLGTANQSIANALGVPVGTRYTAQASGSSGGSSRSSGGSSTSQSGLVSPVSNMTPKQTISYTESNLRGTSGTSSADMLVNLNDSGVLDNLTPSEIKTLMNKFNVTESMLAQSENRQTIPTSGISLPSGRTLGGNNITVPRPISPNILTR